MVCDLNTFVIDMNEMRGSKLPIVIPEMNCSRLELGRRNMMILLIKNLSAPGVAFSLPLAWAWMLVDAARTRTLHSFGRSVSMVLTQARNLSTLRKQGFRRIGGGFWRELRLYFRLQHAQPFPSRTR